MKDGNLTEDLNFIKLEFYDHFRQHFSPIEDS